jgi:hypothetical protein
MAARRDLQQLFTHKALPDHRLDKAIFELLPSNTHYEDAPLLVEASLIPADDPDIAAAAALIAKNEEDCSPDELRARRAVASMTGMAVGDGKSLLWSGSSPESAVLWFVLMCALA